MQNSKMQLSESVCLVTGAARRVGRSIALEFARHGAQVLVHYHQSQDEARTVAEQCTELSGKPALALQADQADPDSIDALLAEAYSKVKMIDVLVNSASVFYPTPFLELDTAQWNEIADVNLRGPVWFCKGVAAKMIERKRGAIVNIADVCSESPWPGYVPYAVSKAGLISLTYGLARELAPYVRVNAIGPGTVMLPDDASLNLIQRAERCAVLQRVGTPEEVAEACVFLVEGPGFITGTFLPVDGGKHLLNGLHDTDPLP